MKNAVPPTTAAASIPTMTTTATTTEMSVFRALASISLHQLAGFVGVQLIIIAFAESDGCPKLGLCRGAVSRFEQDPAEFQVRATVDPCAPLERKRASQVGLRIGGAPEPGARGAALERPQRILPEHARARVAGEQRRSLLEHAHR